jgi:hypothetical protein
MHVYFENVQLDFKFVHLNVRLFVYALWYEIQYSSLVHLSIVAAIDVVGIFHVFTLSLSLVDFVVCCFVQIIELFSFRCFSHSL